MFLIPVRTLDFAGSGLGSNDRLRFPIGARWREIEKHDGVEERDMTTRRCADRSSWKVILFFF